jgi:hypothetical protein
MPIVDMYSSRNAPKQAGDVWMYNDIPRILRAQVSNIVKGALGERFVDDYDSAKIYALIQETVAHEHGKYHLAGAPENPTRDVHHAISSTADVGLWLDVVEISFRCIDRVCGRFSSHDRKMREITISAADAIAELNERFRRAGFGYQYEKGKIFRVDTEFMHKEATLPALELLSDPRFAGADDEFRAAYDHLKAGEFKDCVVDALNALESTMKAICDAKGWNYEKGARASDLLKVLRRERLFPEFADQSFDQLTATLKSDLPMGKERNRWRCRNTSQFTH